MSSQTVVENVGETQARELFTMIKRNDREVYFINLCWSFKL